MMPKQYNMTTRLFIAPRNRSRAAFAAIFSAMCLLGCSAKLATADWVRTDSEVALEHMDFLLPEAHLPQGCTPYPLNDEIRLEPETYRHKHHYCLPNTFDANQWESTDFGIKTRVSYPFDTGRDSKVLSAKLDNATHGAARNELRLLANEEHAPQFQEIDSVRIWVKGNGTAASIRVWLKDKDGEIFSHQRPLGLNFTEWALEDLSFSENHIISHGKASNGTPDPPMVLHRISISGTPETMRGEVKIGRISVVGTPWDHTNISTMQRENILDDKTGATSESLRLRLIERPGRSTPMLQGSTERFHLLVNNTSNTPLESRIELIAHRVLGETISHEAWLTLDAKSRRRIAIPVSSDTPGWYRVVICAHDKNNVSSCLRDEYYVWQPVGNDVEDIPPTFPGAMMSADIFLKDLKADLQIMKQAGVKVLRFPFRWEWIEASQGKYNWRTYDLIFELCHQANIIPQPMVVRTPDWARRAPFRKSTATKSATAMTPPENMETFQTFMQTAASRYAKYTPYWEIWNEPISRHSWAGGTNKDYIDLLRAGYNGVKSADPTARILSAGAWAVDGAPEKFSRHLMEHGREYFDILAVHSHGGVHRLNGVLDDFDAIWSSHQDRAPTWLNETGVRVDPSRNDGELLRASETVKKMVVARARDVENYGWFIFKHMPNSYKSPYDNFSAMSKDGEPRPVLLAYNNTNRWLRRMRLENAYTSDKNYSAYEFSDHSQRVLVAWSNDPETEAKTFELPEWASVDADVYDLLGGHIEKTGTPTHIDFKLTGNPVFIVSDDSLL